MMLINTGANAERVVSKEVAPQMIPGKITPAMNKRTMALSDLLRFLSLAMKSMDSHMGSLI